MRVTFVTGRFNHKVHIDLGVDGDKFRYNHHVWERPRLVSALTQVVRRYTKLRTDDVSADRIKPGFWLVDGDTLTEGELIESLLCAVTGDTDVTEDVTGDVTGDAVAVLQAVTDVVTPEEPPVTSDDGFVCNVCGKRYSREGWFHRHLASHSGA